MCRLTLLRARRYEGEKLFTISRAACLGATAASADAECVREDSQCNLAMLVLQERAKGEASTWAPLLKMLTPAACPWVWPQHARSFLQGTELEPVLEATLMCILWSGLWPLTRTVQAKLLRLRQEFEAGRLADIPCSLEEYAATCTAVSSVVNPWFGGTGSLFNITLNSSEVR